MTSFVACGVEEPLAPNGHLSATSSTGGERTLADFHLNEVSRYSFVWHRDECYKLSGGREKEETALLVALLRRLKIATQHVICWKHAVEGTYKIRCLWFKKKLEAAAWNVLATEGLGLAIKTVDLASLSCLAPSELEPNPMGGWAILFGQALNPQTLMNPLLEPTLRMFGRTDCLEPGASFLSGLASLGLGVAYPATGSTDLPGLVVVSPWRLSDAVQELGDNGVIDVVRTGDAASEVWLEDMRESGGR